ncbi:hypothetical protein BH09DEP1_BH09DEP1_7240 [soil metagenome]
MQDAKEIIQLAQDRFRFFQLRAQLAQLHIENVSKQHKLLQELEQPTPHANPEIQIPRFSVADLQSYEQAIQDTEKALDELIDLSNQLKIGMVIGHKRYHTHYLWQLQKPPQ